MKKNKKNKFSSYEDDIMNISKKEKEILDSYSDTKSYKAKEEELNTLDEYDFNLEEEELDIEEYEIDEPTEDSKKSKKKFKNKHKKRKNKDNLDEEKYSEDNLEKDLIASIEESEDDDLEKIKEKLEADYKDEVKKKKSKKNKNKANTVINIFFTIIILLIILATIDIVIVAKYDKGPYFAIPVKTYDDGGTKEYIGFGYKVIKYNQVQGRKDKEVGFWTLKYNTEPISLDAIDLAIEVNDNESAAYKKYYKKFLRITGTLTSVDADNNKIVISFIDEGKKYNLDVECSMATDSYLLSQLEEKSEVTVIGTMKGYKYKTKKSNATVKLINCFAEAHSKEAE